jgi:uncharacterized protein (TIGR02996 family)
MSDEAALLAAIIAHPDENTPRLMYADWLDENGQPERAEFIRLQCAVEMDEVAEERAAVLEARNRGKWLIGLPQFTAGRWVFQRGFPEEIHAAGRFFLERYDAFARVPWLRSVWLYDVTDSGVSDLAGRSWKPQWIELSLRAHDTYRDFFTVPAFHTFLEGAQVAQLRRLRVSFFILDDISIDILAESPGFDGLEFLQVYGNPDDATVAPLRERFGDRLLVGWN